MAIKSTFDFRNVGEINNPRADIGASDLYNMGGDMLGFGIASGCAISQTTNQVTVGSGVAVVGGVSVSFSGDTVTIDDVGMSAGQYRWTLVYITSGGALATENGTAVSTGEVAIKPYRANDLMVCAVLKTHGVSITDDEVRPMALDLGQDKAWDGKTSLIPSFTGSGDVHSIKPSQPLVAGSTWKGRSLDGSALDPATGAASTIIGSEVDFQGLASVDGDADVNAFKAFPPTAESSTLYNGVMRELTVNKTQTHFQSDGQSLVLSATATYRGLHINWSGITRDLGAPVLEGVKVELPSDYTNFGVSYAGYFSGAGKSVSVADASWALDISGAVRSNNQLDFSGVGSSTGIKFSTSNYFIYEETDNTLVLTKSGTGGAEVTISANLVDLKFSDLNMGSKQITFDSDTAGSDLMYSGADPHTEGRNQWILETRFSDITIQAGVDDTNKRNIYFYNGDTKAALFNTSGNLVMQDHSITRIDTITFTDVNGTIAGIQNQNLLDKTATETITAAWTFSSANPIILTASDALIDHNGFALSDANLASMSSGEILYGTSGTGASDYRIWLAPRNSTDDGWQFDREFGWDQGNDRWFAEGAFRVTGGITATGNVSGATIGNITEANLLDKTATETVSGIYTFSDDITHAVDKYIGTGVNNGYYSEVDNDTVAATNFGKVVATSYFYVVVDANNSSTGFFRVGKGNSDVEGANWVDLFTVANDGVVTVTGDIDVNGNDLTSVNNINSSSLNLTNTGEALILDNTGTGADGYSGFLILRGNAFDGADHEVEAKFRLRAQDPETTGNGFGLYLTLENNTDATSKIVSEWTWEGGQAKYQLVNNTDFQIYSDAFTTLIWNFDVSAEQILWSPQTVDQTFVKRSTASSGSVAERFKWSFDVPAGTYSGILDFAWVMDGSTIFRARGTGDGAGGVTSKVIDAFAKLTMNSNAIDGITTIDTSGVATFGDDIIGTGGTGGLTLNANSTNSVWIDSPTTSWAYVRLDSASDRWDIAVKDDDVSGALQFRPGGSATNRTYIDGSGNWYYGGQQQIVGDHRLVIDASDTDGLELIYFNMAREWSFASVGTTASNYLALVSDDHKTFRIGSTAVSGNFTNANFEPTVVINTNSTESSRYLQVYGFLQVTNQGAGSNPYFDSNSADQEMRLTGEFKVNDGKTTLRDTNSIPLVVARLNDNSASGLIVQFQKYAGGTSTLQTYAELLTEVGTSNGSGTQDGEFAVRVYKDGSAVERLRIDENGLSSFTGTVFISGSSTISSTTPYWQYDETDQTPNWRIGVATDRIIFWRSANGSFTDTVEMLKVNSSGDIDLTGDIILGNDSSTGEITFRNQSGGGNPRLFANSGSTRLDCAGGFVPSADDTWTLGASGETWNELYAKVSTTGSTANAFVSSTTGQFLRSISSIRYKTDLKPITYDPSKFYNLKTYDYLHTGDSERYIGFVAEDIEQLHPTAVIYEKEEIRDEEGKVTGLRNTAIVENYDLRAFTAIMFEEVKKHQSRILQQDTQIIQLQQRVTSLEERVAILEAAA